MIEANRNGFRNLDPQELYWKRSRRLSCKSLAEALAIAPHEERLFSKDQESKAAVYLVVQLGKQKQNVMHTRRVKIGYSNNPFSRIKQLRTNSADDLKLLGFVRLVSRYAAMAYEKRLHMFFRDKGWWLRGEWFRLEIPVIAYVLNEWQSMGGNVFNGALRQARQNRFRTETSPKERRLHIEARIAYRMNRR